MKEVEEYILSIPKFTTKNDLSHTQRFLSYLGICQEQHKIIHVAGTNGKGSVCTYINTMLLAQGETVGLFTSPHLVKINERIVLNGTMISDTEFMADFEHVRTCVDKMIANGLPHPTFFEFLFGMAMVAFARADVEYIVLETGLGGRFDATNSIVAPVASVITSIGMDHMAILGDSLEKIAFEKAGIIKRGIPVIYADSHDISNDVIEKRAGEIGAPCKKIGKDAYEILGIKDKHIAFSCANAYYGDTTWTLNNIGVYQPENAMLALEVMRLLFSKGDCQTLWRIALEKVRWEGRMEEICPGVYVDGAHNISAVERFIQSICRDEHHLIVFSAVEDKDYEEMIACLCGNLNTDFYMVTVIEDGRAAQVKDLQQTFRKYTDKPVLARESLREALQYVLEHQEGRNVYCLGSLYLAGMIKKEAQAC